MTFSPVRKIAKVVTNSTDSFDTLVELKNELDLKASQATTYTKTETDNRIQAIVGAAPAALDTLKEIADQLATDQSAAATLTTTVSTKAPLASPVFTGIITGDGSGITNLNASNLATGSVAAARLAGYPSDETKVLKGDGTWGTMPTGGASDTIYSVTGITGTTATITVDFSTISDTTIIINLPGGTTGANIAFTNLQSKATATAVFSFSVIVTHVSALSSTSAIVFKGAATTTQYSVKYSGGIVPPSTTTAAAIDVYSFFTYDSGASLLGSLAMADVK